MAVSLLIGGVERVGNLVSGSLSITDKINERSQCDFSLVILSGSYRPQSLDAVEIRLGTTLLFSGYVWSVDEQLAVNAARPERILQVSCVDQHLLADRRIVAETYDNTTAGAIVGDLLTKYLAADGVVAGTIQAGPTITRAVFNYISLAQAMNDSGELAGFYWQIAHTKKLNFADRSTLTAPWPLTATAKVRDVHVRRHPEAYRDRQYIRAGQEVTSPRPERFKGDGETQTFALAFPVAKVPSITVNGVARTVGIRGVDTGKDWYWSKGDATVTQDTSGIKLTSTDTLEVTYQGLYPIIVVADAAGEVAARGPFEAVDEAPNLDSASAAQEVAGAKLRRYARLRGELSYETDEPGLVPGQLQTVDLPTLGLSGTYLIEEVRFRDFGAGYLDRYRYTVRALDGEAVGGWEVFFRKLAQQGRGFVIRENEVLVKLRQFGPDVLTLTDTFGKISAAPETRIGYATVGYAEVG